MQLASNHLGQLSDVKFTLDHGRSKCHSELEDPKMVQNGCMEVSILA